MRLPSLHWMHLIASIVLLAVVVFMFSPLWRNAPVKITDAEFTIADFSQVKGWQRDDVAQALPVFLRSCEKIQAMDSSAPLNALPSGNNIAGIVADWLPLCERASTIEPSQAREFFEQNFQPVTLRFSKQDESQWMMTDSGLFTAYYEPVYPAAREKSAAFSAPIYTRPDDLIEIDLGQFREKLAGQRIAGHIQGNKFIPYKDNAQINTEGVEAEVLGWMNPNDLLFLQIQGSGKIQFPDALERIGYAGQNGHDYTAIGRELVRREIMPLEQVSMQSIRNWLDTAQADEAAALRHVNRSYVFFRRLDDLPEPSQGPLGAQNVQLTAGRSLAVDRAFHALGMPVFISLEETETAPMLNRLMIAQDTGGAIKGLVRGDVYLGSGDAAGEEAGSFRRTGTMTLLLPKQIAEKLEAQHAP